MSNGIAVNIPPVLMSILLKIEPNLYIAIPRRISPIIIINSAK